MAHLFSYNKKIVLDFRLLGLEGKKEILEDFDTWFFFSLNIKMGDEVVGYSDKNKTTVSLFEIKKFLNDIKYSLKKKKENNEFTTVNFFSSESYFELIISDVMEGDHVQVELWFPMGILTQGKISGYERGMRFTVDLKNIKIFFEDLKFQLNQFIDNSDI